MCGVLSVNMFYSHFIIIVLLNYSMLRVSVSKSFSALKWSALRAGKGACHTKLENRCLYILCHVNCYCFGEKHRTPKYKS